MKMVKTYWANIYCGLMKGYKGYQYTYEDALLFMKDYVNLEEDGLCVTVSKTNYVYRDGNEEGIIVGLINYPRFPTETEKLESRAMLIAENLKERFQQNRVTIVFPNETIMLGEENDTNKTSSKRL